MRTIRFTNAVFTLALLVGCGPVAAVPSGPEQAVPPSAEMSGGAAAFYRMRADGQLLPLYQFKGGENGIVPTGLLAESGRFYGTTSSGGAGDCSDGCGTVFSFSGPARSQKVLYRFKGGDDASSPSSAPVALDGKLYGATAEGGTPSKCADGCGTIFALDLTTGVESVAYRFSPGPAGVVYSNPLIAINGNIYGTTRYGGGNGCIYGAGCGTIFRFDVKTGVETILYRFRGGKDGANPWARLTAFAGNLYGTTGEGGMGCAQGYGCGTIFEYDLTSGKESIAYRFKGGTDGEFPRAGLLYYKSKLYGTTSEGGGCTDYDVCGTLFAFSPVTRAENVLHEFSDRPDGAGPAADLVVLNGKVYGTTLGGGDECNCGTIFAYDPSAKSISVYRFKGGKDASEPNALISLSNRIYGTATDSDSGCMRGHGCGTIFQFVP